MQEVQRLTSTNFRDIHGWIKYGPAILSVNAYLWHEDCESFHTELVGENQGVFKDQDKFFKDLFFL